MQRHVLCCVRHKEEDDIDLYADFQTATLMEQDVL